MSYSWKEYCDREIKPQAKEFAEEINKVGKSLYIIQLTNQILLFTLLYNIINFLNPLKDFILSQVLNTIIIAALMILKSIVNKRVPKFFNDIISGEFFYKMNLIFNIKSLFCLMILNLFLIFIPHNNYETNNKNNE